MTEKQKLLEVKKVYEAQLKKYLAEKKQLNENQTIMADTINAATDLMIKNLVKVVKSAGHTVRRGQQSSLTSYEWGQWGQGGFISGWFQRKLELRIIFDIHVNGQQVWPAKGVRWLDIASEYDDRRRQWIIDQAAASKYLKDIRTAPQVLQKALGPLNEETEQQITKIEQAFSKVYNDWQEVLANYQTLEDEGGLSNREAVQLASKNIRSLIHDLHYYENLLSPKKYVHGELPDYGTPGHRR